MGWEVRVRFPAEAKYSSLLHTVQTGSEAHAASYPMGTGDSSSGIRRPESEAAH
jgi:hypothetical protein